LRKRFVKSPEAVRATFLLGTMHARDGHQREAVGFFEEYLRLAPRGAFASEATGRLMQLYAKRGDHSRARELAREYLKREPKGPYSRLARSLHPTP
jgi:TolA-binding protein